MYETENPFEVGEWGWGEKWYGGEKGSRVQIRKKRWIAG